jgi:ubiquinone biosynthesis protein COQ4
MADLERDYSYFTSGISQAAPTSSALLSTSKYLNHAGLRDWLATHFLRRNGADIPIPSDPVSGITQALDDLRDVARYQRLIDAEKERNPSFRDWVAEKWLSAMQVEDFAKFDPDSFGGIFYRYLVDNGYALNLGWKEANPKSDVEFIRMRSGQIHDYEHLMTGGGFNSLGELLPLFCRLSNPFRHYSPELAQAMSELYIFVGPRMVMRSFLHYPQTWPTVLELIQRGIAVGEASASVYEMCYEDALHLPIPEAREMLGFVGAEDFDSAAMDLIFTEQVAAQ